MTQPLLTALFITLLLSTTVRQVVDVSSGKRFGSEVAPLIDVELSGVSLRMAGQL